MKKYFYGWGILYGLTLFLACQAKTDSGTIVAKVAGHSLTFESLEESFFTTLEMFEDSLVQHKMALAYLDSLVNQQLLVRAAYAAKLDQDREINILLDEQRPRFLIDELYKMVILEKSEPSTQELKDYYKKSGEQRKLRHILVKDKAEADQIYQELQRGADFEQSAKEKSIDSGSKETGGDLGLVAWGTMVDPFQHQAWKMKVGQISRPVESIFGWHIIKLEEIKKLEQKPFQEMAELQKQRIKFAKQTKLTQEFLDQLREKSKAQLDSSTYQLMLERDSSEAKRDLLSPQKLSGSYIKMESFSESERNRPLLNYQGGLITLREFLEQYLKVPPFQRGSLGDKNKVDQLAFQMVMGDLLEKEAEKRKAYTRPDFKKNILKLKESLMADKMRNDFIMVNAKVTEEDMRNYYDTHLEQFQIPEMVKIQEVLVATQAEAEKLAKQIRAGADFAKLVAQHTLRPGMKERGGIMDSITQAVSAELFGAVKNAKKGQIVGPAPFRDKFSVIRLLERRPGKQQASEEVQPRLRSLTYEEERKTTFQNWLEARKKKDPVEINQELFQAKLDEKLSQMRAARPAGSKQRISGQLPLKVKIDKEGKIEKVDD